VFDIFNLFFEFNFHSLPASLNAFNDKGLPGRPQRLDRHDKLSCFSRVNGPIEADSVLMGSWVEL
jgi:hypothetical protein